VEQLVGVKDAAPPATLPFGKLSAHDRYLRIHTIASRDGEWSWRSPSREGGPRQASFALLGDGEAVRQEVDA
jgi:hypothetical protein